MRADRFGKSWETPVQRAVRLTNGKFRVTPRKKVLATPKDKVLRDVRDFGMDPRKIRRFRTPDLGAVAKKDKQPVSDTELRRKKSHQAVLSRVSGGLALAGTGALGAQAIVRRKPQAARILRIKGDNVAAADRIKDAAYGLGSTAGGVGAIGSLNFASIQRNESLKGR